MDKGTAIFEDAFRNFIAEFSSYLEECYKIEDDLEFNYNDLCLNITGEQLDVVKNGYSKIKNILTMTESNIKTYISDLENVVNAFSANDALLASNVISDISKIGGGE